MKNSSKLSDIKIKLSRLYAEKAALKHKIEKQESSTRKARTRTLIQMGGLLELTPLPALCEIQLGDDLQGEHQSKAALLLGIFAYKEPIDKVQVISFAIIWIGLVFFSYGEYRNSREQL